MKNIIEIGQTFGRWTVLSFSKMDGGHQLYECICSCGTKRPVRARALTSGHSLSCGCYHREIAGEHNKKHGLHASGEYNSWRAMRGRCLFPSHKHYPEYGGHGVKIDPRWNDFNAFLDDMGPRPKGTTLDRIDGALLYSKATCRWATPREQANNRKNNLTITHKGVTKTIAEWAEETGISVNAIAHRLRDGRSPEEILSRPTRKNKTTVFEGEVLNLNQLSLRTGIHYQTLVNRYNRGLRDEDLIK